MDRGWRNEDGEIERMRNYTIASGWTQRLDDEEQLEVLVVKWRI